MRFYVKLIIFIFLILSIDGCVISNSSTKKIDNTKKENKVFIVRGNSLEPIVKEGTRMTLVQTGEYKRNDIIMYKVNGHETPIAKIIKAVPGDVWSLENGKIIINGEILKNSAGEPYNIDTNMLKLFAKKYPRVPDDQYLILGDQPASTLDSSKFGFARADRIIGKLVKNNSNKP